MISQFEEDSWTTIAVPILQGLLDAERADREVFLHELRSAVPEASERRLHFVLANLVECGYVSGSPYHEGGQRYPEYKDLRLLGAGRQVLRDWPNDDPFEALIEALDAAIEETVEPVERTRLQALRESAMEVGQGVLTGVLTSAIRQIGGLP